MVRHIHDFKPMPGYAAIYCRCGEVRPIKVAKCCKHERPGTSGSAIEYEVRTSGDE